MSRFLTKILNEPPGAKTAIAEKTIEAPAKEFPAIDLIENSATAVSAVVEAAIEITSVEEIATEKSAMAEPPAIAEGQSLLQQSVIAGERWTGVPNDLFDGLLRTLKPTDQVCLLQLYRLTWGHKTNRTKVSHDKLAKRCGISKRQAQISALRLEAKGIVRRVDAGGTEVPEYEMLLPPATRLMAKTAIAPAATSKEVKEKAISKEAARCDRCHGTGFWYPEGMGPGKAVKRCRHEATK